VEYYEWPVADWIDDPYAPQSSAISHCVLRVAKMYSWVLVSDSDEFLSFGKAYQYKNIHELLAGLPDTSAVDGITIERRASTRIRGFSFKPCAGENKTVRPKSLVNTSGFLRMNAHVVTATLHGLPLLLNLSRTATEFAHLNTTFCCKDKGCKK